MINLHSIFSLNLSELEICVLNEVFRVCQRSPDEEGDWFLEGIQYLREPQTIRLKFSDESNYSNYINNINRAGYNQEWLINNIGTPRILIPELVEVLTILED